MADPLVSYVDGQPVYIEISEAPRIMRGFDPEPTSAPVDKSVGKVVDALESAKSTVLNVAKKMVGAIREADQAITPDEFELEFAIKFSAEGQAVIAKAGTEASLRVKLTYKHRAEKA